MPKPQTLDEIIRDSVKFKHPFQHFATVIISDKNKIIKGVSQSKPNNLITDIFGEWLAGFFRAPVLAITSVTLIDTTNTLRTLKMYNSGGDWNEFNSDSADLLGTLIQVGAGTTAAARADYNVETAFGTAPESAPFATGNGAYGAGAIGVSGTVVAGGAGTIAEVCMFADWTYDTTLARFLLFHDLLAATEAFVLGETITATYTINL